jgi:hypothetical protein
MGGRMKTSCGQKAILPLVVLLACGSARPASWRTDAPVLKPGAAGAFDETAVKDPSVVFFEGRWHVFYTACGRQEYTTGYVSATTLEGLRTAPRHELTQIRGHHDRYACAPQVFFFEPQGLWYLVCQTRDANYQPVYSTTRTVDRPDSWSTPRVLLEKDENAKWIDFWVICDDTTAYLFYTRDHRDVIVRTTSLEAFPRGWSEGRTVFKGVHEAVHVYKVQGRDQYQMIYELNGQGTRSFGLAKASHPGGPWEKVMDVYATGTQLVFERGATRWTDMISHGEMIRSGYDQRLEYDANAPVMLIQGRLNDRGDTPYADLAWSLGLLRRSAADAERRN